MIPNGTHLKPPSRRSWPRGGISLLSSRRWSQRQYADRPGLCPILDAVLAAAAPLGPATVEARVTMVSLVSARRTFASVKAMTKNRVDLGLRLENVPPEGRLQAARDLGSGTINVRIALASPGEVDEEVTGWLRRAYAESVTPAPRRPARRPAAPVGSLCP